MRPWYKNLDGVTVLVWALLVCAGLTAIYSATHGPAREFLLLSVQRNFNRQLMWFGVSAAVMLVIILTPARVISRLAPVLYVITVGLLVAALIFGREVNGSKSWLYIGPIGLQVSELAKVGTVLFVAKVLSANAAREGNWKYLLAAAATVMLPAALIVLQNDTGTALVFLALLPVLLFWSGAVPLSWMALFVAPVVVGYLYILNPLFAGIFALAFSVGTTLVMRSKALGGLAGLFSFGTIVMAYIALDKVLQPHQQGRIRAFADPEQYRLTEGFHVIQAKAAIGSGGFFGKGFTNGTQTQLAYIPEQSTDFIFCVIGEEFGFIGSIVLLTLFGILIIRMATLGTAAGFALPRLFAAGVTGVLLVHVLINVGMTVGLMPVIGIPLPLISYGGSALIANTAMIAIALNLHARRDEFSIYNG